MQQRAWSEEPRAIFSDYRDKFINLYILFNLKPIIMSQFRFMNLEIWKDSIALNDKFFDLAEEIGNARSYRFAEQLRAASLSISNNIAEGSGSFSDKDFANFLNIARRSVFETANLAFVAKQRKHIDDDCLNKMLNELDILSRKISCFRKRILETMNNKR
jgi:four helix bundle protein